MVLSIISIVDDRGVEIIRIDRGGITFTAPNGGKAVFRLEVGTDEDSVKLVTQNIPTGVVPVTIVDNIV